MSNEVTNRKEVEEAPRCDCCGEFITDGWSFDVWLLGTSFDDETNAVLKTGLQVSNEDFGSDYYVVGNCCKERLKDAWNAFLVVMAD